MILIGDHVRYVNEYERYFFVKRSQVAKKNDGGDGGGGGGKNANRSVGSGVGFWRMSCGRDIKDGEDVIGHCQSLNYYSYNTQDSLKTRKQALKTPFLMHEYTLPSANHKVC